MKSVSCILNYISVDVTQTIAVCYIQPVIILQFVTCCVETITIWEGGGRGVRINLAKNCGSRNEEDEPQLGHHPEAGQ